MSGLETHPQGTRLTLLGTGGAGGVPMVSVGWGACDPAEPRNRRLRSSALIETAGRRILIDTTPDLRQQLLTVGVNRLDAVLFTHTHADHIHGLDDLREVNRVIRDGLPVYADASTLDSLTHRFAYAFDELDLEKEPVWRPWLRPRVIADPKPGPVRFEVAPADGGAAVTLTALWQDHGIGHSLGFRIGNMAYCTDAWELPPSTRDALRGLEVLVVGCLINREHHTHAHVDKVLAWVDDLKPRRTVLTHMGPGLDFGRLSRELPEGVEPGHDGMVLYGT
ncbi:MBL fold metallo-hydrolase [Roseospirillum parvum]|uniref:Phosphoribosyl 1,2-cyclic phosphate phosphodiesterase n=1 Tax=Roseospirillum parvum TaxID=83401 RepID=A0A1G7Y8F1_9PROT|nr:MBL fold metallo-hydrolase [Roseospirillum parvum]SDG92647.1 phosphoribosyl 1,2-cyclic phosphate phosphodiesterase [Roseospirillum parvum]